MTMGDKLAILAGAGALPVALAAAHPKALRVVFDGVEQQMPAPLARHRFEKMGGLFQALQDAGVNRVVLAGAMARPPLDPTAFDATMTQIAPRLVAALQGGDDALLRLVISLFEEQGFAVVGAHQLLAGLTEPPGVVAGLAPDQRALADSTRAADILLALGPLDVGQAAVAEGGLCLGIESLQGTDALLNFVAETPAHLRRGPGGVLVKAPKRGQDLRVDMPAIGPDTVRNAARAGLRGIVIAADQVMLLDRDKTLAALRDSGLFLISQEL